MRGGLVEIYHREKDLPKAIEKEAPLSLPEEISIPVGEEMSRELKQGEIILERVEVGGQTIWADKEFGPWRFSRSEKGQIEDFARELKINPGELVLVEADLGRVYRLGKQAFKEGGGGFIIIRRPDGSYALVKVNLPAVEPRGSWFNLALGPEATRLVRKVEKKKGGRKSNPHTPWPGG